MTTLQTVRLSIASAVRSFRREVSSEDARRVNRGAGLQVVGRLIGLALGVATSVMLGRYLGPAGYGEFSYVLTYFSFFLVLTAMGLDLVVTHRITAEPGRASEILSSVVAFKVSLACAFGVGALVVVNTIESSETIRLGALAAAPILLTSALSTVGLIFNAKLELHYRILADVTNPLSFLLLTLVVIALHRGVVWILACYALGSVVSVGVLLWFARTHVALRPRFKPDEWRELLKLSLPVGAAAFIYHLCYRIDVMILSALTGPEQVGIYAVSYGLYGQMTAMFSLLSTAMFPIMVRRSSESSGSMRSIVATGAVLAIASSLICILVLALLGEPVIRLIYGEAFSGAGASLRVLSFALPCVFCTYVANYAMVSLSKYGRTWQLTVVALLVNVLLNFALVPSNGYMGSSYATVGTELVFVAMAWALLLRELRNPVAGGALKSGPSRAL